MNSLQTKIMILTIYTITLNFLSYEVCIGGEAGRRGGGEAGRRGGGEAGRRGGGESEMIYCQHVLYNLKRSFCSGVKRCRNANLKYGDLSNLCTKWRKSACQHCSRGEEVKSYMV